MRLKELVDPLVSIEFKKRQQFSWRFKFMYSPQIEESQVKRLYRLKVSLLAAGQRNITLTSLVKTAVERLLDSEEMKIRTSKDRSYNLVAEPTDKEIAAENH